MGIPPWQPPTTLIRRYPEIILKKIGEEYQSQKLWGGGRISNSREQYTPLYEIIGNFSSFSQELEDMFATNIDEESSQKRRRDSDDAIEAERAKRIKQMSSQVKQSI